MYSEPSVLWCCWLGQEGHPACKKTEWWGAGVVICLERSADLHIMVQLMPLPLTVSCFSKIQIGFTFWYRLTRVVPDKGLLNGCVCVWMYSETKYPMRVHGVSHPPKTYVEHFPLVICSLCYITRLVIKTLQNISRRHLDTMSQNLKLKPWCQVSKPRPRCLYTGLMCS